MLETDFWWLRPEEVKKYKFVLVGHHDPYSDEPDSDRQPFSVPWYHSVDESENLSKDMKRYSLDFLNKWRRRCRNTNVFRSLALFVAEENAEELLGPFVVDIDREEYVPGKGYVQHLDDALEATRKAVRYLQQRYRVNESDLHVLFTGHKGFNIEVRPQAIGITSVSNRRKEFEARLEEINGDLGAGGGKRFVDKLHDDVRLHNSVNKWLGHNGQEVARMKYELALDDLFKLTATAICSRSEDLVKASLQ